MTITTNPAPVTTCDAERASVLMSDTDLRRIHQRVTGANRFDSSALMLMREVEHAVNEKHAAALRIDFKQATELLAMFGGEPGEVTLLTGEGHSGRGLYAHYSEYPEEGAEFLGVADDEAVPGKQATDQGGWQLVPKEPTDDMLLAAEISGPRGYSDLYVVMLAAAPTLQGVANGDAVGGKSGGAA